METREGTASDVQVLQRGSLWVLSDNSLKTFGSFPEAASRHRTKLLVHPRSLPAFVAIDSGEPENRSKAAPGRPVSEAPRFRVPEVPDAAVDPVPARVLPEAAGGRAARQPVSAAVAKLEASSAASDKEASGRRV